MNLARYLFPLAALAMTTSAGFAQTAAPAAPAPSATKPAVTAPAQANSAKKTTMSAADKSAKSKECSAQADQKGLHGKARKRFRDDCKRH